MLPTTTILGHNNKTSKMPVRYHGQTNLARYGQTNEQIYNEFSYIPQIFKKKYMEAIKMTMQSAASCMNKFVT